MQEVPSFLAERTGNGHVAVGRKDLDIMPTAVPTETPGVHPAIEAEAKSRELLCETDVAELPPVRRGTGTDDSDNPFEVRNEDIRKSAKEIAKMQVREDKVDELRSWKEKVDEVVSPTQLSDLKKEVESLTLFKTKAITVFAVIQFGMAAYVWMMKIV